MIQPLFSLEEQRRRATKGLLRDLMGLAFYAGVIVALAMLIGCSGPAPVIEHRCLPMVPYTAHQVTGVVAEIDKAELTGISMPYTEAMIVDYKQMRKDNRTCKGTK